MEYVIKTLYYTVQFLESLMSSAHTKMDIDPLANIIFEIHFDTRAPILNTDA